MCHSSSLLYSLNKVALNQHTLANSSPKDRVGLSRSRNGKAAIALGSEGVDSGVLFCRLGTVKRVAKGYIGISIALRSKPLA